MNDDSLGAATLTSILEGFGRTTSLQMAAMAAGFIIACLLVWAKRYTKCRSLIIQAHILSGQAIAHPVLLLLQTPDDILGNALLYLRIMYLGIPIVMAYNLSASVLRLSETVERLCMP